jgi:hypothetical protein
MLLKRAFLIVVGACLCAAAGMAVASSLSSDHQADFFARGTHRFYVWCPSHSDYYANADGANAEDAQLRLYGAIKAKGTMTCWPVWQGRVVG